VDGFHTGDAGYVDEAGYVFLKARQDTIISVERSIPGRGRERALRPSKRQEVAVVGVPDEALGRGAQAFIVLALEANRREELARLSAANTRSSSSSISLQCQHDERLGTSPSAHPERRQRNFLDA